MSGITPLKLAMEFILWPPRLDAGVVEVVVGRPDHAVLVEHFVNYLLHQDRSSHKERLRDGVRNFLRHYATLDQWYEAVLTEGRIDVAFHGGAAWIDLMNLPVWRQITARLDGDALLCSRLARHEGDPEAIIEHLPGWGILPRLEDAVFERIMAAGMADTHVHLEACDPIPGLWCRIMEDPDALNAVPRYSHALLDGVAWNTERHQKRLRERDLIREAGAYWRARVPLSPLRGAEASNADLMARERRFLVAQWQAWQQAGKDWRDIQDFDRYLVGKHQFLAEQQQFPGSGGGLERFREYLDRGRSLAEARSTGVSPKAQKVRFRRLWDAVTEHPDTRRVELRIAPRASVAQWARLFTVWERMMRDWAADRQGRAQSPADGSAVAGPLPRAAFIVHFIRRPGALGESTAPDGHFGQLRRMLDRQTACLQLFRAQSSLAHHIVGIDAANLERGCSPDLFIPFFRLLRGATEHDPVERVRLAAWSRLPSVITEAQSLTQPRLGLTYHVGEDFYTLAEGLRHIDLLLDRAMVAGDRIGHGLALGLDAEEWLGQRRDQLLVPCGVLLDDLVWLYRVANVEGALTADLQGRLERAIGQLTRLIYQDLEVPRFALEGLAIERTRLPPANDPRSVGALPVHLFWLETFDPDIRQRRAAWADADALDALACCARALQAAQAFLARKIAKKGVTVEANPSSNLATGSIRSLGTHPMFTIVENNNGIFSNISINTDDPSTFATRIDFELGHVYLELVKKIGRAQANDAIERLRRNGMDSVFFD